MRIAIIAITAKIAIIERHKRIVEAHSAMEPQPKHKHKPKTFETQRNRGSGGQKEETGKSELEEQKPNLIMRKSREGKRKQTSNLKVTRSRRKGKEDLRGWRRI